MSCALVDSSLLLWSSTSHTSYQSIMGPCMTKLKIDCTKHHNAREHKMACCAYWSSPIVSLTILPAYVYTRYADVHGFAHVSM